MPLYEFGCASCGHVFEELCKFDEEGTDKKCPKCGHVGARRLISVFTASGLENGFMGLGKKWGGSGGSGSKAESSDSGAGGCGSGACGCANN